MQQVTAASLKQRIDQPFLDAVVKSAGLTVNYEQLNYVAMEGPGGSGEVKPVTGVAPLVRFNAKCPQLPDLDMYNGRLDLLRFSTYHYLIKTVRFCVVVDGVEIFGSATALRDHGFFMIGNEIRVTEGQYYGDAYICMEPLTPSHGRDTAPYHRFFARRIPDLSKVNKVLNTKGKVKEICFLPGSFDQLLNEDAFLKTPESWG